MGFRSTFTTEDYDILWPQWFREKYSEYVWFREDARGAISSKFEAKTYDTWEHLPADIQRAIDWENGPEVFTLVYLHECGGITRCVVKRKEIIWSEPKVYAVTDGVTHDYCQGCSDRMIAYLDVQNLAWARDTLSQMAKDLAEQLENYAD